MERAHQIINTEGLQIPLPIIEQLGVYPGAAVVLEFEADSLRIVPLHPSKTEIENRAMQILFKRLGDAIAVRAERKQIANGGQTSDADAWSVYVYGQGIAAPLGQLDYSLAGELKSDLTAALSAIRQKAAELSAGS